MVKHDMIWHIYSFQFSQMNWSVNIAIVWKVCVVILEQETGLLDRNKRIEIKRTSLVMGDLNGETPEGRPV